MNTMHRTTFLCSALFVVALAGAGPTAAYTIQTGDQMLKTSLGVSNNFMRYEVVTKDTPANLFVTGINYEYALDGPWNAVGHFMPGFADGFIDFRLGAGAKYRLIQLDMPLIPYAEAQLTSALGVPTRYQEQHFNLGMRTALGVDYFVMRQFAVGIELGWELSGLFSPEIAPEMSAEGLFCLGWKF
jgi:hypothetical protein